VKKAERVLKDYLRCLYKIKYFTFLIYFVFIYEIF
ncbi:uncharacterized protein METZ01_LOCUS236038, partial [marine metagenome]